jgi:hypothetical protein
MNEAVVFLFIDESVSQELDTASLTGVLVPASKYVRVRDAVLRLSIEVQHPPENYIPQPIELHGVLFHHLAEAHQVNSSS